MMNKMLHHKVIIMHQHHDNMIVLQIENVLVQPKTKDKIKYRFNI